jgi:LuxR family maltose regulon positive regulatory protein
MHLVIATREDPHLPLTRLRGHGQLSELRASDLRFTSLETALFLNQIMGLDISTKDIDILESRTEGWIAGLQLAAISIQGSNDASRFIESFNGSHHFILDYLMEEVLNHQPEFIQSFLLKTSILERMCGSLCDSVLPKSSSPAQETLRNLDQLNMFIIPLDNERRWYRYHHLFGELLRQRLGQSTIDIADLHIRASQWFENNGFYWKHFIMQRQLMILTELSG